MYYGSVSPSTVEVPDLFDYVAAYNFPPMYTVRTARSDYGPGDDRNASNLSDGTTALVVKTSEYEYGCYSAYDGDGVADFMDFCPISADDSACGTLADYSGDAKVACTAVLAAVVLADQAAKSKKGLKFFHKQGKKLDPGAVWVISAKEWVAVVGTGY